MKIDIYTHIVPQKYGDVLRKREAGTLLAHLPDYWETEAVSRLDVRLKVRKISVMHFCGGVSTGNTGISRRC